MGRCFGAALFYAHYGWVSPGGISAWKLLARVTVSQRIGDPWTESAMLPACVSWEGPA